jgi:hypothetical protein
MTEGTTARRGAIGVVVLGMGRSGTSAVTEMFVAAGFHAGAADELMPANAFNPRGYFENLGVYDLNEEILERLGAYWFHPPSVPAQVRAASWAEPKLRGALERLIASSGGRPIAVKDPRITGLITLWAPVISERLHPVLVVRDPLQIARSLLVRDQTPIPFALAAWELQTGRLLEAMRGRTVTVAPYRTLLHDGGVAAAIVGTAAGHVDELLASRIEPAAAAHALDASLSHNEPAPGDHERQMTVGQLALWRELEALAPGDQRLDLATSRDQRGVREETVGFESVRTAVVGRVSEVEDALERSQRQSDAERSELAAVRAEYERAVDRVRAAESAEDEARAALERSAARREKVVAERDLALRQLDAVRDSRSWRITSPLRAAAAMLRRTPSRGAEPGSDPVRRSAR